MPEYTEADVARLAGQLGEHPVGATPRERAIRLLDQGVTLPPPPPDPAVVVAHALRPYAGPPSPNAIAAVRDLFTPEALEAAAAKVQEDPYEAVNARTREKLDGPAAAKVQEAGRG